MVTKTQKENRIKLSIGAIITLALVISGTYYLADTDQAYYCEAKDLVMICEKLSSGIGSRCYYDDTYKICKLGWEKIEVGQELIDETHVEVQVPVSGTKWLCSPEGCTRLE